MTFVLLFAERVILATAFFLLVPGIGSSKRKGGIVLPRGLGVAFPLPLLFESTDVGNSSSSEVGGVGEEWALGEMMGYKGDVLVEDFSAPSESESCITVVRFGTRRRVCATTGEAGDGERESVAGRGREDGSVKIGTELPNST